ncbi:periplasmic binding protein-like II [Paraphaeosphaeria sporulosa]|uniref:Periplasmic binding protein-like II n=1 Tax=Paraphaeosphaeria sporulosa TaxID=1460663 RepID=A0A177C9Z1_9PLEO|nr:periplasmic binding protein-like II [Paraphaeosphaeria sporulosa]OAG03649.1 periplasmic binding protein-like II [Paraphaeosphaeria sporulosa]
MYLTHLLLPFALLPNISALKIATSLQWIEHTPQAYAIKNFYKGSSPATLSSGGVANLASDSSIDLAANAETQGLKQYANHKSLRLIYIITEVSYRLVARSSSPANVKSLADLKGKKIGSMPGTSAAIFVQRMLASAGVNDGAYSIVSGNVCMKAPCGSGTLPAMLKGGQVDAFGIWEPAVELGIRAIGKDNAVVFQNATTYREVYSLYTTTDKLADPKKRADIVAFVRALNQTLEVYNHPNASVYSFVADRVGMDAEVVEAVWADHKWSGTWKDEELMPLLVDEDAMLAKSDRRAPMSRAELETFLDTSVIEAI